MLLSFAGVVRPVRLVGCDGFAAEIAALLRGWQVTEIAEDGAGRDAVPAPAITVEKTGRGFRRTSPWLSRPAVYRHPVNAACDFLVDLMKAYIADNPQLLCLHCAAARFADGLVVFPSTYKAGKSLLAVSLAAAGVRLFADDVLPVAAAGGGAIAPGFLPRLRLPLPDDAGPALRRFVAARAGPRSDRFLYVDLAPDDLAPLGETAPIRAIVLLERDAAQATALTPASRGAALGAAIRRNFSRNLSAVEILDRLHDIVDGARCLTLRYRSAAEAADTLCAAFGGGRA